MKHFSSRTVNTSTLFRASTLSTMLMDQFMKLTASQYLQTILKEPIAKIMESTEPCEVCTLYMHLLLHESLSGELLSRQTMCRFFLFCYVFFFCSRYQHTNTLSRKNLAIKLHYNFFFFFLLECVKTLIFTVHVDTS